MEKEQYILNPLPNDKCESLFDILVLIFNDLKSSSISFSCFQIIQNLKTQKKKKKKQRISSLGLLPLLPNEDQCHFKRVSLTVAPPILSKEKHNTIRNITNFEPMKKYMINYFFMSSAQIVSSQRPTSVPFKGIPTSKFPMKLPFERNHSHKNLIITNHAGKEHRTPLSCQWKRRNKETP